MELFRLLRQGTSDEVRDYFRKNPNVNANIRNENGQTPLYWACERKNLDIIRAVIERGADVNSAEQNAFTPLHLATFLGNVDVMKVLLENGARVDVATNTGATPLHLAAKNGNIQTVTLLLDQGADANTPDSKGQRPSQCSTKTEIQTLLRDKEHPAVIKKQDSFQSLHQQLLQEQGAARQQFVALKQEIERLRERDLCQRCRINSRDTALLPCSHLLYCYSCAMLMGHCDACGKPVVNLVKCTMTLPPLSNGA